MSESICSANECDREVVALGLCLMHYKRFKRHGDPNVLVRDTSVHSFCLICGAPNPPNRQKYCSEEHGRVGQRTRIELWHQNHPEERKAASVRATARRRQTRHNLPEGFVRPTACGICGDETDLHVDHDHKCCLGKYSCGECVAGFLCNNCNNGLGRFKDDPARLRAAADYIERTRGVRVNDLVDRAVEMLKLYQPDVLRD